MILAQLLLAGSFLSGWAYPVGESLVRPEQLAGPLVALALLFRRRARPLPRVALPVLAWILLGAFSAMSLPDPQRALVHAIRLLATVAPVFALPALLVSRADAERAWNGFLALIVLEALVALACAVSHEALGTTAGVTVERYLGFSHPHGTLLEPNLLGMLSAVGALAFGLRAVSTGLPRAVRWRSGFLGTVLLASLAASVTRAAWIALLIATLACAALRTYGSPKSAPWDRRRSSRSRLGLARLLTATVGLGALLLGFGGLVPGSRDLLAKASDLLDADAGIPRKVALLGRPDEDPNVGVRLRTYEAAMRVFSEHPLFGAGHGAMERLLGDEDRTLAWAGNLEVHLLADTGVVGLSLILGFVGAVFARTLHQLASATDATDAASRCRARERFGALLILVLCAQATETSWLSSFWVLMGLALAASADDTLASQRRSVRPKTRILYVHPSDELYGSDRVLLDLVKNLDRGSFEPHVLLSKDVPYRGLLTTKLRAEGITVWNMRVGVLRRRILSSPRHAARYAWDVLFSTFRIARLLIQQRIEIVHANTVTVLPAAFAARLAGRRLLWHIHEIVTSRPGRGLLQGVVLLLAHRVVVVSHAAREALCGKRSEKNGRVVEVIPNGSPDRGALPFGEGAPVVAYIGRLSRRKGPFVLLQAAARVLARDAHSNVRFVFEGDEVEGGDAILTQLRLEARRLGIEGSVEFRPFREDVRDVLAQALVVVSPSILPESFGLILLEAMMAGRAVVASDHGGPRELVAHKETGLLVPPGDPAALAAALEELLASPEIAPRMGANGRARALREFPLSRTVHQFEALYWELLTRA